MTSALRTGDIVRIRDERWCIARLSPGSDGTLLEVRGYDRANRGTTTCFLLPCEPCERVPQSTVPRVLTPRAWRHRLHGALATTTPAADALRTIATGRLAILPYQLEPALAVTSGLASRILIADDVGLGKTVQAGLVISETLHRRSPAHVLIVAPAGLRSQWRDELRERLGITASLLDALALARHQWASHDNPWSAEPVIVTSLDYVKRPEVIRSLESLVWDVVIFDEAHALAGQSDRALAARAVAERARTLLLLTATPHSGDDVGFERLCGIGDLRQQFPLLVFRRTRDDVGLASTRRAVSIRVRPTVAEAEMHRVVSAYTRLIWSQKGASSSGARLAASVLCRRACSSAASLARSVERRLALLTTELPDDILQGRLPFDDSARDDEGPASELALPGLHDAGEERRWLTRLLELARRASRTESKVRALTRLLRRVRQPAIVFTEYRDTATVLAAAVASFAPLLLHGGLTPAERQQVTSCFTAGRASLLLATDAASEGLNLQHCCRLVVNLELPWTPLRLEQRIGRVDRIGQRRRVHAVHLLAAGTSEETSVARLVSRRERATTVLNDIRRHAHSESDIAGLVIGGHGMPAIPQPSPLPANVVVADCREPAQAEAARLELTRALALAAGTNDGDHRPCITVVTRRSSTHVYWIYTLDIVDREGRGLWNTAIAITSRGRAGSRDVRRVRGWFERASLQLEASMRTERERLIGRAESSLQTPRSQATRREQAIHDALAERQARLSARLLQGALFDRREEHDASAQQAVVTAALARTVARLRELDDSVEVAIAESGQVFAFIPQ